MRPTAHKVSDQRSVYSNALFLARTPILVLLVTIGASLVLFHFSSSSAKLALLFSMKQSTSREQPAGSILTAPIETPTPTSTTVPGCGAVWRVVPSPTPPGEDLGSGFNGLSAVSADNMWAVGYYDNNGTSTSFVAHWDGSLWNYVPSPNVPGGTALVGVSAVSANDIWAVGHTFPNGPYQTVTMHWDGIQWSLIPSPSMGTGDNILFSVAAIATNDVWAAGFYYDGGPSRTLIEHWDGVQWSVVPSPNAGIDNNVLWSLAAVAPDDVWAVGDGFEYPGYTLTEHWDGTQWSIVPSPNIPGTAQERVYGVSAVSSDDVWAVGSASGSVELIMHWDGSQWNLVSAPVPGRNNYLYGVSAAATDNVWAVGDYFDNTSQGYGLSLHWDGTSWTEIPVPNVGLLSKLQQVVALPGSSADVWAVGAYQQNSNEYALIEHYSDLCITPSPTVTGTPPTGTPSYTRTSTHTRTPTVTGTPPTSTPTITLTPTYTPSPTYTPGQCDPETNYIVTTTTGAVMDPIGGSIGGNCVNCMIPIQLPFPFHLYDQTFSSANVSSNGNIQFASNDPSPDEACLPYAPFNYAIMPFWAQLYTNLPDTGIYTSVAGIAPNRTFDIEWFADMSPSGSTQVAFELRLYENSSTQQFDIIYQEFGRRGANTTVGMQLGPGEAFTQYECNTYGTISYGLELTFNLAPCGTPSATPSETRSTVPSATSTAIIEPSVTAIVTLTAGSTATLTTMRTATPSCIIQFTDVPQGSTFYPFVHCLACLGLINGYPDGTFKPNNEVTRGQLSKIVSNSAGFSDPQSTQLFQDVPLSSTFQVYIGRLASRGYINGYPCGGPGEPCVPPDNLPYFRPSANATRGQISKIVSNAAGFSDPPSGQRFQDAPVGSTYYTYTYRLVTRGVMSGYPCGSPPAGPCVPPANLPYFRPNNNATRGQTSKIDANTFFPDCNIP